MAVQRLLCQRHRNLIELFKIVKSLSSIKHEELFTRVLDLVPRGHKLSLQCSHTRFQIGDSLFTNRVIPLKIRLTVHVVNSNNMDGFEEAPDACRWRYTPGCGGKFHA